MTGKPMVYLDNAAATRICPSAANAMMRAMTEDYGNPSSRHEMGARARTALQRNRETVAGALECLPEELYFTSGGTESDNWAILAAAQAGKRYGRHIITTALEHAAVLETTKELSRQGFEITYLPPDSGGSVSLEALKASLRPDTILVSMMLVNNETGTELPVRKAAEAIREAGSPALLHTDAAQGFLKVPFSAKTLGAQLITISGHKIRGPKGIGALYVKKGVKLPPLLWGGGQENGLRPGTEPTPLIAGFAAACALGRERMGADAAHMQALKEYSVQRLEKALPSARKIGKGEAPHILCLTLPGYRSEVLVRVLSDLGVCVSAGSACHRGRASHVLASMKLSPAEREGAFRVSFSPDNTQEEADALVDALVRAAGMIMPSL
ncbi:MAG: cysteine desulfurase family protein [Oscillospiraceae bacterium]|nr:cysteine desulfurase family protein [Oscillospiraceae bacterium]